MGEAGRSTQAVQVIESSQSSRSTQVILSVGIDLGTTTTKMVVSELTLRNTALGAAIPRIEITGKKVVYRSEIHFTPLTGEDRIDAAAVFRIIEEEYRRAGVSGREIKTGAVIITGEAAKKANAEEVVHLLADRAGDFVVATAGPDLEGILAGKGSGAAERSRKAGRLVANLDIGGGTTNIAVFWKGNVLETCTLEVGGRAVEIEAGGKIRRISRAARVVAAETGIGLREGRPAALEVLRRLADRMAACVAAVLDGKEPDRLTRQLLVGERRKLSVRPEEILYSGGVGELIMVGAPAATLAEVAAYNDIGPLLAVSLRQNSVLVRFLTVQPAETIRATVVGAGAQATEVSGTTIFVEDGMLPLKNIPVVKPAGELVPDTEAEIAAWLGQALHFFDSGQEKATLAVALPPLRECGFGNVAALARGIVAALGPRLDGGEPVIVLLSDDVAKALGQMLKLEISRPKNIICLDQVKVENGDYVDIGRPLSDGRVVPVIAKTLAFA